MKTYKKLSSARTAAKGLPLLVINNGSDRLFVVVEDSLIGISISEVSLLDGNGAYAAHITLQHLDRLGNGNYAIERPEYSNMPQAFPKE